MVLREFLLESSMAWGLGARNVRHEIVLDFDLGSDFKIFTFRSIVHVRFFTNECVDNMILPKA